MSFDGIYKKKFEELAQTEERFMEFYKYYAENIKDPYLLAKFKEIYEDERRHVGIARNFVQIISAGLK